MSLLIALALLYKLRKIFNEITLSDINRINNGYRTQVHSFSGILENYGFNSELIENLIFLIQADIKKKERKNELRSKYTFQFSLVLFGVISFFSKQLWEVLDISKSIKNDIYSSSVVIVLVIGALFYLLLIFRVITDPKALKYSEEERVLTALQEVLIYRKQKRIMLL